ncbi:MAG: immunity 26/phosphotriesterase HocA family protein [Clostridia bacterium]|nr:immunity 26/phosphotriesterase HocA family protein [Clostridia bacterium]
MDNPFWELSNEQRPCFGITPVTDCWERIQLPRSKYDSYDTVIYLDGDHVRYIVRHGEYEHLEHALDETLTPDRKLIVPKRATKPIKLSAATIAKRSPVGMCLCYIRHPRSEHGNVSLYNTANMGYYRSWVIGDKIGAMEDFQRWCACWCEHTTKADLRDITAFAARKTQAVKLREGDVFRFRWTRGVWGYGRILLDYRLMRKQKIPFFDCLMGPPLAIEVFKIITRDPNLSLETILSQETMPSQNIMDNPLHFGEFEIIGHAPIPEDRDERCPIMYGKSHDVREQKLKYQQGRIYRELPNGKPLGEYDFRNCGIGWSLDVSMAEVLACIQQGEVAYWDPQNYSRQRNLRNPSHAETLKAIREQMGV